MEAANLGAWMAPVPDAALDDALAALAPAPDPTTDPDAYVEAALEVRRRWPDGGESLGVPTWVYIDEPTTGFATHIAKYFTNSIREDGLLAIARSGVVYAPGGAGTEQEIFTDSAQNSLTLYGVRSPIVFFGRDFFEAEHPRAPRRGAAAGRRVRLVAPRRRVRRTRRSASVHRPARPRREPDGPASNGGASIREPDDAGTRRPRARRGVAVPRKRSRASAPSSTSRRRSRRRSTPKPAAVAAPRPGRSHPAHRTATGSMRVTSRSSPSTRRARWISIRRTTPRRRPAGFRVHYAIADVAAFVAPGGALDRESFARGVTLYLPDGRAPMLPERRRPRCRQPPRRPGPSRAPVDDRTRLDGRDHLRAPRTRDRPQPRRARLPERAGARSTAARADASLALLREIGSLRRDLEAARGGDQPRPAVAGSRRRRPTAGSASSTTRRCRSRVGTRRSRCSPASRRPKIMIDARRGHRAHAAAPADRSDPTAPAHRPRARRRVAEAHDVGRGRARARSHPTRRRRVPHPGRARAARRRLREARRDEHRERGVGADPRRCRGAVRARDRAPAPPRRPLRERDRARPLRGRRRRRSGRARRSTISSP